ncbi:MAG: hypothetical protein IJ301_05845 [Clostridia bacterium]|nr:hypothetical protein [Clostridia bacterium]
MKDFDYVYDHQFFDEHDEIKTIKLRNRNDFIKYLDVLLVDIFDVKIKKAVTIQTGNGKKFLINY